MSSNLILEIKDVQQEVTEQEGGTMGAQGPNNNGTNSGRKIKSMKM